MSRTRTILTTVGIMLGLFMASMEATVIATAMPTIVSELGGLAIYSWAFSAYMLASTTTVPVYGKLSDIYGRRPVFLVSMTLFLVGSILCGLSQSMGQLVAFRAIQGLGAGGIIPLVFIIVGDIFNFEQRAKMQGLFSGVWGVSSVVGPLLGGFLVDQISWHWVFFVNVVPGIIAAVVVWFAMQDRHVSPGVKPNVDYAGAILLSATVVTLLLGLFDMEQTTGWILIGVAFVLAIGLIVVERRAADPILPLKLFRQRLFASATTHGLLSGWAMFGSLSFVPLFVQAVLGTSATEAGSTLTPMLLGWVVTSIIGSRALLYINYRLIVLVGTAVLTLGAYLMTGASAEMTRLQAMIYLGLMGSGMGLAISPFLIAVQSAVRKRDMGTATSTLQFSRNIGGTLGVSVMGAVLAMRLASGLTAAGVDPNSVSLDSMIDPVASTGGSDAAAMVDSTLQVALGNAIQGIFWIAFIAAVLALAATFLAPRGRVSAHAVEDEAVEGEQPLEAAQPSVAISH
ncbi:MAG: MFS transporter [Caldilineaceae bacterium]|nr:MFS transporter [Caldilineaceae bacterium]